MKDLQEAIVEIKETANNWVGACETYYCLTGEKDFEGIGRIHGLISTLRILTGKDYTITKDGIKEVDA